MSRDGTGVYNLPAGQPVVTGTTISSTTHNTLVNDLATALTQSISKDGQTVPTANLPMGGFRLTGIANAIAVDDAARVSQVQNNAYNLLAAVAGTANAITASATPTPAAYAAGQKFILVPASANTGATTINVSSLGVKNIFWNGAGLIGGELRTGVPVEIEYDGTQFNVTGNSSAIPVGLVTTKGDSILATGNAAIARKAAPADGYIRMADAAQADGWLDVPAAYATSSGKNIAARTDATTPASKISITADELIVRGGALAKRLDTVNVTIDIAVAGANGLDTGAEAANTWYYGWVIATDAGAVAGLLSASSSAPTLPAGYTWKALVSAVRNDASSNFIAYRQFGNEIIYEARLPILTNGVATVETAVSTASFIPPPATSATLLVSNRVAAGAAGATSNSAEVHYISGVNFFLIISWANTSTTNFSDATVRVPNVGQNIYYSNNPAGAAATNVDLTIYVIGFTLPGGGE